MYATVSGGIGNFAGGSYSSIGGGSYNQAQADHATVGGGDWNTVSGLESTVGGGTSNHVMAPYSTIGGGVTNTVVWGRDPFGMRIPTEYATICAGLNNLVGNDYSSCAEWAPGTCDCGAVSGGCGNSAIGPGCTVGGGYGNTSCMEFWNDFWPG